MIIDLNEEAKYWNTEFEALFGVNPQIQPGCSNVLVAQVQSAIFRARNEALKSVTRDMEAALKSLVKDSAQ